jgi:hypothetical protein
MIFRHPGIHADRPKIDQTVLETQDPISRLTCATSFGSSPTGEVATQISMLSGAIREYYSSAMLQYFEPFRVL